MKSLFVLIYLLLCSTGFSQQTITQSLVHDSIERSYILYIPASYTPGTAVPLLFNFHGYGGSASQQMLYGDFRPIADTANFIIVHPEGTIDDNNSTHFNVGWGFSNVDDVGFTSKLIDTIASQYDINLDRVYTTGMSNGGFMSFLLACELSERLAAVGSVTGSTVPETLNTCNPTHPIPIIQIHGDADGIISYNNSYWWSESIPSLVDWWVTSNSCAVSPIVTNMPDIDSNDGSTVIRLRYTDGANCSEVVHYKVVNGDHTWPGSAVTSSGTNYDINASLRVWNFVSQYDINGKIGCSENAAETPDTSEKEVVQIIDVLGRETEPTIGTPLIYVYGDGSTKKVIRVE